MKTRNMRYAMLLASCLALGAAVGCEKEPAAPTVPQNPPPPQPQVQSAVDSAVSTAQNAAASVTAEAQKLIDQATTYIKENKLDLADQALTKLEAMKAQLPAEWQAKVVDARSLFDKAKAAAAALPGGVTPPAMPR